MIMNLVLKCSIYNIQDADEAVNQSTKTGSFYLTLTQPRTYPSGL